MLDLIFTLDYEIHGNGTGDPLKLMVEPVWRLMELMEKYGARLTIFVDMAEVMKFRDYYEKEGDDRFGYLEIKKQLQSAVIRGHDVQLHIHSSYFNAVYDGHKWNQSWEEYNFAGMGYKQISYRIGECKKLLEEMIRERVPGYRCFAFRAANWSMQPTPDIAEALKVNGLSIDSSVYKHGRQKGWVNYDYSGAYDGTFPYPASSRDICLYDSESNLWEFPIHCELHPVTHFVTPMRVYRVLRAMMHRHRKSPDKGPDSKVGSSARKPLLRLFSQIPGKYPMKFDFNQLSGRQMIKMAENLSGKQKQGYVTLIAHSKTFTRYNALTLEKFLKYLAGEKKKYRFSLFPPDMSLHNETGNSYSQVK